MPHFRVMAVRDIVIFLKEQSKAENVDAFLSTLGRRVYTGRSIGFLGSMVSLQVGLLGIIHTPFPY